MGPCTTISTVVLIVYASMIGQAYAPSAALGVLRSVGGALAGNAVTGGGGNNNKQSRRADNVNDQLFNIVFKPACQNKLRTMLHTDFTYKWNPTNREATVHNVPAECMDSFQEYNNKVLDKSMDHAVLKLEEPSTVIISNPSSELEQVLEKAFIVRK